MEKFVKYNYKKILFTILVLITLPLWLNVLNYIFDFIIRAGRITGTIIRYVGNGNVCIM